MQQRRRLDVVTLSAPCCFLMLIRANSTVVYLFTSTGKLLLVTPNNTALSALQLCFCMHFLAKYFVEKGQRLKVYSSHAAASFLIL